ncbi:MAG: aconitase/3-isopropylmalate dehydratase large subunit family protein [bacterium]|nr:aconitase/3-isopropylmalate dehydratase large subunit family protein [bacterium]
MGLTLTEKIFARHAQRSHVAPGDNVWVDVDVLMTHDVCGPGTIGVFEREFGTDAKVFARDKIVLIPDHYIFTADKMCHRNVDILRTFAQQQQLPYFYDPQTTAYKGVCHVALAQEGHCRPGEILLGTDSHTCTAGAFGEFATGIGNTDAGFVLGTGKLLLKVPASMRFVLEGALPPYLMAKDLLLRIIGLIGVDGATYRAMEFSGSCIAAMTMEERMTICNMAIEAGGKNGIIAADATTRDYVTARTDKPFIEEQSDAAAQYFSEHIIDVATLEPAVAQPHSPDHYATARAVAGTTIDQAYIGSCTGGKLSDFVAAARILAGRSVRVPTYLVPATVAVKDALATTRHAGKPLTRIFEEAGCLPLAPPSCAACLGGPSDTFGRVTGNEVVISTTNRNFPGRMGSKNAGIYLASPYTVAASAVQGAITDPREYLA